MIAGLVRLEVQVDLKTLLGEELAPFASDRPTRIRMLGPQVKLPPELAQTVALVLHELTTNAAKHGALYSSDGELSVSWELDHNAALAIRWKESWPSKGPNTAPSRPKQGFGVGLLAKVVQQQLGGSIDCSPNGSAFCCAILIPLHPGQQETANGVQDQTSTSAGSLRVLIAEDEPLVAMDIEDRLQMLGYGVLGPFDSVDLALSALGDVLPDLAVLDVNLRGTLSIRLRNSYNGEECRSSSSPDTSRPMILQARWHTRREFPNRSPTRSCGMHSTGRWRRAPR